MIGAAFTRVPPLFIYMFILLVGPATMAIADEDKAKPEEGSGLLTLDYGDIYLEFESEYAYTDIQSRSQRFPFKRKQTNRELGFEERFGLTLGGTVIDAKFLTYRADLNFALAQDRFEESTNFDHQSETDSGFLLEYDARVNIFPGGTFSGSVYGLRRDDRINRRFQPTLTENRTGFGTSWVFAHDTIPMELTYDFTHTRRRGNRDRRDDEEFTDNTLHYNLDWHLDEQHILKVSYDHSENQQRFQGTNLRFETTRDLIIVDHEVAFGQQFQHTLRTRFRWQEESGDFARDIFEIGPQLTISHSDTFQTSYKYQFNRERYAGLDVETQRVDFQAVHQLYTNLTTTFDAFALYEDVENDINTTQYGASVDWQYNRNNRFGQLRANLSLAYDTEEVDSDEGRRLVLDESGTFRDPIPITLRNRNVEITSVVVTDAGNRRLFTAGLDYVVFRQGDVTRIARTRTGLIADGDTVLVDYLFRTPAHGQLDTVRVDFNLEQKFNNGLTPYYRLSYRNQEDDVSFGFARRADRTNHHRLGVRYEKKKYSLDVEYEIFDDTIEPYDAFHVNGLYHILQSSAQTIDVSSRLSRLLFEGGFDDRNVTLVDVQIDHRLRLSDAVSLIKRLGYRYERDSSRGITQAWDMSAGLDFQIGQLSGELVLEYDRLGLPESEEEDYGMFFRVRREFADALVR